MDEEIFVDWTPQSMVEVIIEEADDFLKIKETLTRVGVASSREQNTLFQSCHILHKQGRYFIVHFKELFLLDGKPSTFTRSDEQRRNTIVTLLSDWGLLMVCDLEQIEDKTDLKKIKVLSHKEKRNWDLRPKYRIGQVYK